jgi:hypothetical protein
MSFGESILTGAFCMSVVFAVLIVLWGMIVISNRVINMVSGAGQPARDQASK